MIEIQGIEHYIHPGQVGVYLPDMIQRLRPAADKWEFRCWTMDGLFALGITVGFGFSAGVFTVGSTPIDLFSKLENAIRDLSKTGEMQASAITYELLSYAATGRQSEGKDKRTSIKIVLEQIHRNWNDPQLSISSLAENVGLHSGSLTRLFTRIMQISPSLYIKNLRIQNALTLLKETNKSVTEISRLCGYNDPDYFSRLIRSSYGLSPKECRKLRT